MVLQFKLSLKFFLAFLLTSLTIVILMIVIMEYFAYRNFTDYVHTVEIGRLNELSDMLSEEYQLGQGWDPLRGNWERWHYLLRPLHPRPGGPPPWDDRLRRRPPPPKDGRFSTDREKIGRLPPDNSRFRKEGFQSRERSPRDDRGHRGQPPHFGIEHRLTLFDSNKKTIVGPASSTESHTLKEIIADNQTVGWLGLKKEADLTQPLDIAFLKQQTQAFYMTGVLMLALAAVAAFLFARHLLAPVKQLTDGTRALASRSFETRIQVKTNDELGQLAADFNNMARTLENYEQMHRQWISDIAHELRTPLSVLQGEIEALQDGVREISPDSLCSLHAEVSHLSSLVRDLHDLSLAESGSIHYQFESVDLLTVLWQVMKKFENRFKDRNITLIDELDANRSQSINGDRNRLVQVFSNLLENSLRYTEPPGMLKIRNTITDSGITLHFEDSAPGVPPESLERLFDRLYRVDKSRSRSQGSSGLGLAICRSIIEAHNGTIRAFPSSLGGVLFEIIVPLNR